MIQKLLSRLILMPFSLMYGMIIGARNLFYDTGLLKATIFNIPIISVGNLSLGGAGKTPHIEFLINTLAPYLNVATLSRGYKRKSKGFKFVTNKDNALTAGDEPLQYRLKFNNIVVAVSESRTIAIPLILKQYPDTQLILLDDAFQHRAIVPGLNILLTTFDDPFTRDILMPAGRLREYPSSYKRADIIIVSKCPADISENDRKNIREELNPQHNQELFFTSYKYNSPRNFLSPALYINLSPENDVILVSAIASTSYLKAYLESQVKSVHQLEYEDHHNFSERDINYIEQVYINRDTENKIILTTEKDAMRLNLHKNLIKEKQLPIYILPIEVSILFDEEEKFISLIKTFLLTFKV